MLREVEEAIAAEPQIRSWQYIVHDIKTDELRAIGSVESPVAFNKECNNIAI
jgi:hypothetical protein